MNTRETQYDANGDRIGEMQSTIRICGYRVTMTQAKDGRALSAVVHVLDDHSKTDRTEIKRHVAATLDIPRNKVRAAVWRDISGPTVVSVPHNGCRVFDSRALAMAWAIAQFGDRIGSTVKLGDGHEQWFEAVEDDVDAVMLCSIMPLNVYRLFPCCKKKNGHLVQ